LSGLGADYWKKVIEVLALIIHDYDKVNRVISFGRDNEFRIKAIKGHIFPGETVLDAGSGFGNMANIVLREVSRSNKVVIYDPIIEMLINARNYFSHSVPQYASSGVFEYLPFRNEVFDVVMYGYSLRDSIELRQAIAEAYRVLKLKGRVIIVDLGKPDNPIIRAGVSFYLKYILKILAFAAAGKSGLKFKTLYGTYIRWPTNSELNSLLYEKFSRVEFNKSMMGGAIMVSAQK
jgi:demethylmenaquinone methyltransferase / 2-methoxy-6-polyprenyl-1,4-benzoquinol methylase